jgi:hypothetical protein
MASNDNNGKHKLE